MLDNNEVNGAEIPKDYSNPDWEEYDLVHNWRNHIPEEVKDIWHTFTNHQKQILAMCAAQSADNEDWD